MKNWTITIYLLILALILLSGCIGQPAKMETTSELWGSFTGDQTYSYDEKYYAIQEVEDIYGTGHIKVCIYETKTDKPVFCFYPARARDFWGICWENDTYNIWIQSGDIGVYCYRFEKMQWEKEESAQRPAYIVSKYDKYMKSNEA